ncbi:MAG TPA: serine hydrolase [Thermoanaerobaculia bacterium]|jgi:CubicO group peptidase (beta-lactamase class C family)|nr:serine hydrolase [Thermoanaerobaculia bacterium]
MRPLSALFLSFLFSLSSFAANALGAKPLDPKGVDRLMNETMRAWQIPGASIAIVQNDQVVFLKGYGTKELGGKEAVTPDTLFQIASTTKAFTSTSLAMLASDKKLDFDDPVRKHVPYFRLSDMCADQAVTLRDIVSHRTGLSRHDELWDDTALTREDVIRALSNIALTKPFRSAYQYQNITFITAGEAVAHAAGMSWDDFVKTRIFAPLKMTNTVTTDAAWNAADHATGYRFDWKTGAMRPRRGADTTTIGPGGAIKSSARDMANWIRFHLAGGKFEGTQLVDADRLAETKKPHTVIPLEGATGEVNPETQLMAYAMGWNVSDYKGELLVAHAGALNGFRTHVILLPKRNAGMFITINVERGYSLYAMRHAIADLLLTGKTSRDWNAYYLALERKTDEKSEKDKEARLAKRVADTKPTRPLAEYAGVYENPSYGPVTIHAANGGLVLQWQRIDAPLTHYHYDVFDTNAEDVEETVTFNLDEEQKVKSLTVFGERFEHAVSGGREP